MTNQSITEEANHTSSYEGEAGGEYGRSLWVHSQMSGGATIGQESQQLGRAGCGMQESEDKLESTGTSMSVVAVTNPIVFSEQWLPIHSCFPNLKQLSFFTNFNLCPYSCSLTKLTHINSLHHHKVISVFSQFSTMEKE